MFPAKDLARGAQGPDSKA